MQAHLLDIAIFRKTKIWIRIVRVRKALRMKVLGAFFFCTKDRKRMEDYFLRSMVLIKMNTARKYIKMTAGRKEEEHR